jgi:hypothetical protein
MIIVGGSINNSQDAVWVFIRNGSGVWLQQSNTLVPTDAVGNSAFGSALAISADGNTAIEELACALRISYNSQAVSGIHSTPSQYYYHSPCRY